MVHNVVNHVEKRIRQIVSPALSLFCPSMGFDEFLRFDPGNIFC